MSELDYYKCPECGGDAGDYYCPECDGDGYSVEENDDEVDCDSCSGAGYFAGEFVCFECGATYSETDVEVKQ